MPSDLPEVRNAYQDFVKAAPVKSRNSRFSVAFRISHYGDMQRYAGGNVTRSAAGRWADRRSESLRFQQNGCGEAHHFDVASCSAHS